MLWGGGKLHKNKRVRKKLVKHRRQKFPQMSRSVRYQRSKPRVSVIIPIINERRTISGVIRQASRVHLNTEVVVVSNGTTDGSDRMARAMGARVLHYGKPLGHDVGRSIGAQAAHGDVLLFIDGDMIIQTAKLRPFIQKVLNGTDVVLNKYSGMVEMMKKHKTEKLILARYALNTLLSRSDLKGASMTSVPHAMSRRALNTVGAESLSIPPLAQVKALYKGLHVVAINLLNVDKRNRFRGKGKSERLRQLIHDDHLQAVRWLLEQAGYRGGYSDFTRQRWRVNEL